ncbi:hypothetical protein O9Z70_15525 [Devosia sp. YIM 151766]|uniref:hypothetical protein n=1 Tax=Devosia sp. YIM 151766 TaxID=3017325 RepID=UPI00255CAB6D|nr:hypothetical protein [Devosia sp. YIM 151766]WIY52842.1 hypothetical protein O9Z70_15525 [Devosia sp. YIM 151766]
MTAKGPPKFPYWAYALVLLAILIFALWPLASVYLTYLIADANGCQVNEARVQPCLVLGADWGGLLYNMGVMGWFMLATLPLGGGAFLVWLASLIIHRLAWGQKQKV